MTINIHAIDRDNGDGRYRRRYSFRPFAGPIDHLNDLGLIDYQDTDGGHVATVEAPAGARIEGDWLMIPGGPALHADETLGAAQGRPWLSYGLRLID